jgi:transposase
VIGRAFVAILRTNMKNTILQNGGGTSAATTQFQSIKLGLDVHADSILVVRIVEGQAPQPGQRFQPEKFLDWVRKQQAAAQRVYSCYEAGPLGYGLHRQLLALGVTNYVVRPRDWDEYGSKVKTDQRDAHELALCLDRYVSGNSKAFSVVRVPTPEEEQARSATRHREALKKDKQRVAARGRGLGLYYGHRLQGQWWSQRRWSELEKSLPGHLLKVLGSLRRLILAAEAELKAWTEEIEQEAPPAPRGVGSLTTQILDREVADWNRFKNRRQVASYTGLCPREDSSGPRRFQGSVNKHGNRRLRPILVECAWRLLRFQPNYRLVRKWREALCQGGPARRKQIIVAMARQFTVDWWRLRTGRTTAEKLGLVF